jgi:phosphoglycerate dehydrogenase-like enzyme
MKNTILITDTLFVFPEHEDMLHAAGFEIERLDKSNATEKELVERVKGKVGYILGGIEKITDKVIEAADELRVIAFTGSDARAFIPGFDAATKKGIAISSTPAANGYAVAEYTITLILGMTRNIFELGRAGDRKFQTTRSLNELTVGVIGMGHIGERVVRAMKGLGAKEILYFSRTPKLDIEKELGVRYVTQDELLAQSDIVSLHASQDIGYGFIGKKELALMKDGALLVNCGFTGGIEKQALFEELKKRSFTSSSG